MSSSAIGIPRHQFAERRARQRLATAARHRLDRQRKLTRRHAPERIRRKPQHTEAEADGAPPGERRKRAYAAPGAGDKGRAADSCGLSSPPKVAAIRSAAMRT
jgi:hypothetical protein